MIKNYHCEETGDQLTEILRPVEKAPLMEEGLPWIVGSAVVILLCVSAVAYLLVHSRKKN